MDSKKPPFRRARRWFGRQDRDGFIHRSWMKNQGLPHDVFDGRPVIGICNTWSRTDALQRPLARTGRICQARRL